MPRTVSLPYLQAALAQQTGEAVLECLTISHPSMTTPIRVVNDTVNLTRTAGEFIGFPFKITLPPDDDENPPQVTLTIDNVDRSVIQALRGLDSPPTVTLEVVLASSPDTAEAGPYDFELKLAPFNALTVQGTLGFETEFLSAKFPADSFTPAVAPGLFS